MKKMMGTSQLLCLGQSGIIQNKDGVEQPYF